MDADVCIEEKFSQRSKEIDKDRRNSVYINRRPFVRIKKRVLRRE